MRYYKAVAITGPEASFLMQSDQGEGGQAVVVSCNGVWYDVRALSAKELEDFMDQLARVRAGCDPRQTN
jgi:hypothetical protein